MNINKKCIIGFLGVVIASPVVMKSEKSDAFTVSKLLSSTANGIRRVFGMSSTSKLKSSVNSD